MERESRGLSSGNAGGDRSEYLLRVSAAGAAPLDKLDEIQPPLTALDLPHERTMPLEPIRELLLRKSGLAPKRRHGFHQGGVSRLKKGA